MLQHSEMTKSTKSADSAFNLAFNPFPAVVIKFDSDVGMFCAREIFQCCFNLRDQDIYVM